jgi:hypothetical protein
MCGTIIKILTITSLSKGLLEVPIFVKLVKRYEHDYYLDILFVRKFRYCYAQIRSGSRIRIRQSGRHQGIPREQRLCNRSEIDDKLHFMFKAKFTKFIHSKKVFSCSIFNKITYIVK